MRVQVDYTLTPHTTKANPKATPTPSPPLTSLRHQRATNQRGVQHGMLVSGGEVTVPKLFVNNANGRLGLVGYWDVVAFDEFAGKKKRTDKALVDIMKNYMANKTFSRGVETLGAEASMVFVGNTSHTVPYMLKHSDLFDELPESYHDSAFLDRLHHYIPGWEVDTIRGEMFSSGYGFVVDYIAEVLKSMRSQDFSDRYQQLFTLSSDISTRDRDGIHKTLSGLMKILYPHGEATEAQIEEILRFAIEGRKRVKDQILRIDSTIASVKFGYTTADGAWRPVTALEQDEFPVYYNRDYPTDADAADGPATTDLAPGLQTAPSDVREEPEALFEGHKEYLENQRGVSYESLLMAHLQGAKKIVITDPYIRLFHQARNLMDLVEAIAKAKDRADEIVLSLITSPNDESPEKRLKQVEFLNSVEHGAAVAGITFDFQFDNTIHDRSVTTDTGWRIILGRGLDIFQYFSNDAFDLVARLQEFRQVKAFGVTYIREPQE